MSTSCQYWSDRLQDSLNGRVPKRYANDNRQPGSTMPRQHHEYEPPIQVTDDAGSDDSVPFVVRDDESGYGNRRHYRDRMYPEQFPRHPNASGYRHHERMHEPPPIQRYHDVRDSSRFGPRPQNYGYPSQGPGPAGISPGRVPSTGSIIRHPDERMRTPGFSPHGQLDAPIGTPASDLQSSHRLHEVQSDEMNDHENRSHDPMHEDFDPARNVSSDIRNRETIDPRELDYENGPEDPEVLPPSSAVDDLGPVPRDSIPQDQRSEVTIDGEHVVLSISDSFERPPSIEPDELPPREMGLGPNLGYQRSQRSITSHSRQAYGHEYPSSSGSRHISHPNQYRHNYPSSPTGYSDDSTLLGESEYYESNWPRQRPRRGREFDYIDYSSGYEYTSHTTATFYLVPEGINCVFVDDYGNEISRIGDPSGHRRYPSHRCRPPVIINDEFGRELYRMGDWGSDHFRRGGRGNKCTRDHTRPLSIYRHEYVRRKDHRDRYGRSYGRITRCTQIPRGAKIVIIDYDGHQVHLT